MSKLTTQKTIRIYNDENGSKFVVEESPDPGTIDMRWTFRGDDEVSITDIPVDLCLEIARALNEVALHINTRDRVVQLTPPPVPFTPAIGGVAVRNVQGNNQ